MRTKFINKQGIKWMIAAILLIAVLCTSVISAYYIIGSRDKGAIDGDLGDSLSTVDDRKTTTPLPDGAVPANYVSSHNWSGWTAIGDAGAMNNWLWNDGGKNAYLTASFNYMSDFASNDPINGIAGEGQTIKSGRIFDGCGFTLTMTTAIKPGNGWTSKAIYSDNAYFIKANNGTFRNTRFVFPNETGLWNDNNDNKNVGGVVGWNNGIMTNIGVDINNTMKYTCESGSSKVKMGGAVGVNDGTISYVTVNIGSNGRIQAKANKAWNGSAECYVGGVVGLNNSNVFNCTITCKRGDWAIFADSGGDRAHGGIVGRQASGATRGVMIKGKLERGATCDSGVAAGKYATGEFSGIYSDFAGGMNNFWIAGNGNNPATQDRIIKIKTTDYDITFAKSATYYNDYALTSGVAIQGKNKPKANSIPWKATGTGNDGINANLYESMATGWFTIPQPAGTIDSPATLAVEYGSYGSVKSITAPTGEYDGTVKIANKITYNDLTNGVDKVYNIANATDSGNHHIFYYGGGYAGGKNAGTYKMSAGAQYINEGEKFYVPAGDPTEASNLVIDKRSLTPSSANVTLTAGSNTKVYDGNTNANATVASNTLGVAGEAVTFLMNGQSYASANAGSPNLTIKLQFLSTNPVNSNYKFSNGSIQADVVFSGQINKKEVAVTADKFTADMTKTYDGNTDYVGTTIAAPSIATGVGSEKLTIDTISAKYSDKNVATANKQLIIAFKQTNTNYSLNITPNAQGFYSVNKANAVITPKNIVLTEANLANVAITKIYDGTTAYKGGAITQNGNIAGVLAETITLKTPITAEYNIPDVTANMLTVTLTQLDANYTITSSLQYAATITKNTLELAVTDFDITTAKDYDGTLTAAVAQKPIAAVLSQQITLASVAAVYKSKDVATTANDITVTFALAENAINANYELKNTQVVSPNGTINKKAITVTDANLNVGTKTKIYDGNVDYADAITQKGDIAGVLLEKITLAAGITAVFNSADVATANKIIATISQADTNYTINGTVDITGATITPKAIDIPNNTPNITYVNTKIFDNTTAYTGAAMTQVADTFPTTIGTDKISLVFGNAVYNDVNVANATKLIVDISQTNTNYSIPATVELAATITPKELSAAAYHTEGLYNPTLIKTFDGNTTAAIVVVAPIDVTELTITFQVVPSARFDSALVGKDKTITVTLATNNTNFIFSAATNSFVWSAKGEIEAGSIAVTVNDFTVNLAKEYDGTLKANVVSKIAYQGSTELIPVDFTAVYSSMDVANDLTITISDLVATVAGVTFTGCPITVTGASITTRVIKLTDKDFTYANTKAYDGTNEYKGATITVNNNGVINNLANSKLLGAETITVAASGTPVFDKVDVTATKITFNVAITAQPAGDHYSMDPSISVTATITPAVLTLTASDFVVGTNGSRVYDSLLPVAIATANGLGTVGGVHGETITLNNLKGVFAAKDVAAAIGVTITYTYENANYTINTTVDATGEITPYEITADMITIDVTNNKIYDATTGAAVTGHLVTTPLGETVTLANIIANYDNKNVGAANKTINATFSVTDPNYIFAAAVVVGGVKTNGSKQVLTNGTITAKEITILPGEIATYIKEKIYDGTTAYKGLLNDIKNGVIAAAAGDDVLTLVFSGAVYTDKNVAFANNKLTLTFSLADTNYTLSATTVEVDATIAAAEITPNLTNFSYNKVRVYNNSTVVTVIAHATNVINGVNGETITLSDITAAYNTKDKLTANKITISFACADTNYRLTTTFIEDTTACSITAFELPKEKVVFLFNKTKDYDATVTVNGITYTISGLGFDEDLSTLLGNIVGAYDTKDYVEGGNKRITITYAISNNPNFVFAANAATETQDFTGGIINKLAVTPNSLDFDVAKTREYTGDNTVVATYNNTLKGANNEVILLAPTAVYTGSDFNIGSGKTIKLTYAFTADAINNNYTLPTEKTIDYTACEIIQKKIDITTDNFNYTNAGKTYNGNVTADVTALEYAGVLAEKVVLNVLTARYADKNVGVDKEITVTFELSNALVNKNYIINNTTNSVLGKGTITQADLAVTFNNTIQSYRNNNHTPLKAVKVDYLSGIQGGDPVPAFAAAFDKEETFIKDQAGTYRIVATSSDDNYKVVTTGTLTMAFFRYENGAHIIETVADFEAINNDAMYLAYNFKQLVDLDVNFAKLNGIKGNFTGVYDGNGKKIMNAFLFDQNLFNQVTGTIKNLALVNTSINTYTNGAIVGGIVGTLATGGLLENVLFEGGIYVAESATGVVVGGIVGVNNGALKGVTVIANIEVENGAAIVGGIVGKNAAGSTLTVATDGTINTSFAEVIVTGATAKSDSVVGENAGTVDNTSYLNGGAMLDNETTKTIATGSVVTTGATAKDFATLANVTTKVFDNKTLLDTVKTYRNDYNLNLTATYELQITNLREYELIGQYSFLNVTIMNDINFHKGFTHTPFAGAHIGTINMNNKKIDNGNINQTNMYVFNPTV